MEGVRWNNTVVKYCLIKYSENAFKAGSWLHSPHFLVPDLPNGAITVSDQFQIRKPYNNHLQSRGRVSSHCLGGWGAVSSSQFCLPAWKILLIQQQDGYMGR